MNRDDIIRMARETDLVPSWVQNIPEHQLKWIEDFATLVAAAEREACAKVCGELADNPENSEQYRMGANWARERIRARGQA